VERAGLSEVTLRQSFGYAQGRSGEAIEEGGVLGPGCGFKVSPVQPDPGRRFCHRGFERDPSVCRMVTDRKFDEVYQLAADMGGAGFVFTGDNDADIMHNSALINLNVCEWAVKY